MIIAPYIVSWLGRIIKNPLNRLILYSTPFKIHQYFFIDNSILCHIKLIFNVIKRLSMKKIFLFILLFNFTLFAQVQISGNLQTYINNIINNLPEGVGNNEYIHPASEQLEKWGVIIDSMLVGNFSDAHLHADSLGYRVVEYTDNSVNPNVVYYMLEKLADWENYWGTFIFHPDPERAQLVIQSPHPKKDFNTGKQGFYIFRESGARVFLLAGTSRCNSSSYTSCSGTTTVCSESSEAYRISDQAHTTTGTFQKTTERLIAHNSNFIHIQLHGFEKLINDPDVIMSNGVQNSLPPEDHLIALKNNLLLEDSILTFQIAHIDTGWNRLLGTTNTQGRLINESLNPCNSSATFNSGQFLHLEQVKDGLRNNQTEWEKMSNAIKATFQPTPLPVELTFFSAVYNNYNVELFWKTATEINNYGFEVQRASPENRDTPLQGVWEQIGFVAGYGNSNSPKDYYFVDENPKTDFIQYRLKQIDTDGKYSYSHIVRLEINQNEILPLEFILYQNYPNPFNPSTTIKFSIPQTEGHNTGGERVLLTTLKIYDILGYEVSTLVNEEKSPGVYEVEWNATGIASGLYFYRLQAGINSVVKKLILLR